MNTERLFKTVVIVALIFLMIDKVETYHTLNQLLDNSAKSVSRAELILLAGEFEFSKRAYNTNFIAIFNKLDLSWHSNTNKTR